MNSSETSGNPTVAHCSPIAAWRSWYSATRVAASTTGDMQTCTTTCSSFTHLSPRVTTQSIPSTMRIAFRPSKACTYKKRPPRFPCQKSKQASQVCISGCRLGSTAKSSSSPTLRARQQGGPAPPTRSPSRLALGPSSPSMPRLLSSGCRSWPPSLSQRE